MSKDENCTNIDTVIDILPTTRIEILENENSPRFGIIDKNNRSITLEAQTTNQMMQWILVLRSKTFQVKKLSMENFRIISVIGRGVYGKVMLVEDIKNPSKKYAIKSVRKSKLVESDKVHTVLTERNVLAQCQHPFIVSLYFAFQTPSKFYFGLEYSPGGEIFFHMQKRGNLPLEEVKYYISEISLAFDFLHKHHIIYRDLKPENVLLDFEGFIKLTDFGLSKDLSAIDQTSTFCGTAEYLAPELVNHQNYDYSIDWWTLGIFTFELLYGHTPFANPNRIKMFQNIISKPPAFPHNADPGVVSLVSELLIKDPKKRATFKEIKENIFFEGINFDDVLARKIKPPFVPDILDDKLTPPSNFDSDFTSETAADSFTFPIFGSLQKVEGFSYTSDELTADFNNSDYSEKKLNEKEDDSQVTSSQSLS